MLKRCSFPSSTDVIIQFRWYVKIYMITRVINYLSRAFHQKYNWQVWKNKWYLWMITKGNRTPNCWGYYDLLYYWRPSGCLLWLKWLGSIILKMINASIIIYLFFVLFYLFVCFTGRMKMRPSYLNRPYN